MSQISPTFNAGGGGKTYRIANNLTIDYDTVDELKRIWQNQIAVNKEVMEIVATSPETMELHAKTPFVMDTVATSQTAMDAVAASGTARDVIGTSGTAYDKISVVELAIGKYVAGFAGLAPTDFADISAVASDPTAMDTVATSQTAMDALSKSQTAMDTVATSQTAMDTVATSQTAMDAVANSQTALNTVIDTPTGLAEFLASPEVNTSFWSDNTATETFWDHNGDLAESYWQLNNDSRHGGQSLFLDADQFPGGGDRISWTIDMTTVDSITVFEKTLEFRGAEFEILVGGRTEFSANNNNTSYVGRTVDVSDREGNQSLAIGLNGDDGPGRETLVSDIQLN